MGAATTGFTVGVILLLGLRQLESHTSRGVEDVQPRGLPMGLLVAVGLDLFVDGILVGLSVATLGDGQGILLAIALTLVVLPLALSVTVELTARGVNAARSAIVPPLLTLLFVVGALGAVVVLGSALAAVLSGILALGLAALLFLAAEELLVEAHEARGTPLLAAMLFVGFFALYLLDAGL